jgi:hypothetical protein
LRLFLRSYYRYSISCGNQIGVLCWKCISIFATLLLVLIIHRHRSFALFNIYWLRTAIRMQIDYGWIYLPNVYEILFVNLYLQSVSVGWKFEIISGRYI